ncbi:hypothetical protein BC835DRAFT_461032 [Cytidiella melzeri]|nr:hypothetical protein BC835DRAFT_461032 [Cytidiella melzeri]
MLFSNWTAVTALALLNTLILSAAGGLSGCGPNHSRDDEDDSDGDSATSSSRSTRSTSTSNACSTGLGPSSSSSPQSSVRISHQQFSNGAEAGIIISILVALLAVGFLLLWYRRRRNRRREKTSLAAQSAYMGDKAISDAVEADATRSSNIPASRYANGEAVPNIPLLVPHGDPGDEQGKAVQHLRNLQRSRSISSMPNPYDFYNPERNLPPVPPNNSSSLEHAELLAASPSSMPSPTSPFTSSYRESSLTRGDMQVTSSTHMPSASLLHAEMRNYEKRLEAHHEKELAMAGNAHELAGPSIPADPPPSYTEIGPFAATSE